MSPNTKRQPGLAQITLLDEVMSVLGRGEVALFADLAHSTWDARATLADLTGTLHGGGYLGQARAAA